MTPKEEYQVLVGACDDLGQAFRAGVGPNSLAALTALVLRAAERLDDAAYRSVEAAQRSLREEEEAKHRAAERQAQTEAAVAVFGEEARG